VIHAPGRFPPAAVGMAAAFLLRPGVFSFLWVNALIWQDRRFSSMEVSASFLVKTRVPARKAGATWGPREPSRWKIAVR
jgi:hypothetical protein